MNAIVDKNFGGKTLPQIVYEKFPNADKVSSAEFKKFINSELEGGMTQKDFDEFVEYFDFDTKDN